MATTDYSKASWHAGDVEKPLEARGFAHLRVRARGAALTIESGPENDPIRHARFKRDTVHLWILEIADHKGRFSPTGLRNDLPTLVDALIRDFGWTLEPIA